MSVRLTSVCFAAVLAMNLTPAPSLAQSESIVEPRNMHGKVQKSEREEQADLFDYYFEKQNLTYETQLDKLKTQATVPSWRIPYSAAIHPQSAGGMSDAGGGRVGLFRRSYGGGSNVLNLYDRAFNSGGEGSANAYERQRVNASDRGLFRGLRMRRSSEPWEGYCSGFTAASIRHPEPVRAVDAGQVGGAAGVVFQPSDIKALLTCIYNRTSEDSYLFLAPPASNNSGPNMGTFHLTLANYIGQAGCPVGIDRTKGEVAWNNPIYAYESTISDGGEGNGLHYKNVQTTITYSFYGSDSQTQTDEQSGDRQGNMTQSMSFNYTLALDGKGKIVGGHANSYNGDFLWLPLYAVQGRGEGPSPGNPHIDVRKVIALARLSALPEAQKKYDAAVIGPRIDPSLTKAEEAGGPRAAAAAAPPGGGAGAALAAGANAEAAHGGAEKAAAEKAAKVAAEKAAAEKAKADKARAEKVKTDKAKADKAAAEKAAAKKAPADAQKKAPAAAAKQGPQ